MIVVMTVVLLMPVSVEDELGALVEADAVDDLGLAAVKVVAVELADYGVVGVGALDIRRGHKDQSAGVESVVADQVVGNLLVSELVLSLRLDNGSYPWEGGVGRSDLDLSNEQLGLLEASLVTVVVDLETIEHISSVCRQGALFLVATISTVVVTVADLQSTDTLVVLATAVVVIFVAVRFFVSGQIAF